MLRVGMASRELRPDEGQDGRQRIRRVVDAFREDGDGRGEQTRDDLDGGNRDVDDNARDGRPNDDLVAFLLSHGENYTISRLSGPVT